MVRELTTKHFPGPLVAARFFHLFAQTGLAWLVGCLRHVINLYMSEKPGLEPSRGFKKSGAI